MALDHHFSTRGTSPRTRGKLAEWGESLSGIRNIPAHAGKTTSVVSPFNTYLEHPRARGENCCDVYVVDAVGGTSPRTRGKRLMTSQRNGSSRNIPAHAGKTKFQLWQHRTMKEHPRARGENAIFKSRSDLSLGTSPRTRGKLCAVPCCLSHHRNIPAHAGKTYFSVDLWYS